MKFIVIFMTSIQLLLFAHCVEKDYNFFPNLPAGKFRINFKSMGVCDIKSSSNLQQNLYISKISPNAVEIKGNFTIRIPFNDTFSLNIMMSVKDSIGGWKDNAYLYTAPKGCTAFKKLMGSQWNAYMDNFGIKHTDECRINPGVYISKGFNPANIVQEANFPKTFFYGTYKMRIYFEDRSKIKYGCLVFVIEVKRKWETE